ncbi:MAG: DUF2231 domain-containing protein [Nitrospirota bacterium]
MGSRASFLNHPIHPMLVPFPIALWIFSLISDAVYGLGWGGTLWNEMAFYTMAGGIVGALAAAVPGLIDYLSMSDPETSKIAKMHMIVNLTVVGIFIANLWLRTMFAPGAGLPVVLSVIGVALLGFSGWLGGELVYVHGVGVDSPAERSSSDPRRISSTTEK